MKIGDGDSKGVEVGTPFQVKSLNIRLLRVGRLPVVTLGDQGDLA
jgi:hypothetical protein